MTDGARETSARSGRGPGHRIADLDGWRRIAVIATVALFGAIPLAAAVRTLADGWIATGDVATIGLRSRDAWTPAAPLLGQPTTGQERSGIPSNHPGPIENWLLGPGVRLLGPSIGLLAGVAALNGAALVACTWLAYRRGGPALLAIVAAMLALLVWSIGPFSLFDPFNSELPTYPMVGAALAAWCVLSGDLRVTPAFVALASLAAQPHVAAASLVLPLVLVVGGSLVLQWRRKPAAFTRSRPWMLGALGVGVACWLPPIAQELVGPSNLSALWRTQGADGPRLGLVFVIERLVNAVAPIPLFARTTGTYGFLGERSALGVLGAALVIGLAGTLSLYQRLVQRKPSASLLYVVAGTIAFAALVSWSGSPPISAYRSDSFRWPWVASFLLWLALAWAAWLFVPARGRALGRQAAPAVGVAVAVLAGGWAIAATHPDEVRDARFQGPTSSLAHQLTDQLPAGRYHLTFEGGESVITVGPGLVLALEDAGWSVTVEDDGFGRAYGDRRTGRRAGDLGNLLVANGTPELGPDDRVVAETTFEKPDGTELTITVVDKP